MPNVSRAFASPDAAMGAARPARDCPPGSARPNLAASLDGFRLLQSRSSVDLSFGFQSLAQRVSGAHKQLLGRRLAAVQDAGDVGGREIVAIAKPQRRSLSRS